MSDLIELAKGTIVDANGSVANMPVAQFTPKEAQLLRDYQKLLRKYHLREALYCNDCWGGDMGSDGCRAFVTETQIGILCRCKMRVFQGSTV
jgi:hypothetical protein